MLKVKHERKKLLGKAKTRVFSAEENQDRHV